jgi:MerR family Zn(II)-responsive transcriptional regulator of zntA
MALKQEMTVKGLAERVGVSVGTVRHYARIGLLSPRRDAVNGYKLFFENDIRRLKFIRNARMLGFSLDEIGLILEQSGKGESPCLSVRQLLQHHIEENRAKIEELTALQLRMERALEMWNKMPDMEPSGTSICHLIESFADLPD